MASEPAVRLEAVSKHWGEAPAVDRVSLTAAEATFVVLLGPSGCGKSTTLRMIAGLEEVSDGRIHLFGRDVTHLPPAARRLSMVFQSYALFPHLTVAENIVFGLRVRRVPRAEREQRLQRVAQLTGLGALLDRKPAQLSGGQRQRVALARAIVAEHPLCLMDEPLSNLDAKLRHEMRNEIRGLQQKLGMTVLYVTHDQVEAMSMADQVLLLNAGRIDQRGTPEELYDTPASTFAAAFIGSPPMNLLTPISDGTRWHLPGGRPLDDLSLEAPAVIGVRPEHLRPCDPQDGLVSGTVQACEYLGADTVVTLDLEHAVTVALRHAGRLRATVGETMGVTWEPGATHTFAAADGRRRDDWTRITVRALETALTLPGANRAGGRQTTTNEAERGDSRP